MSEYRPFLLLALARLRTLTFPQMLGLCDGRVKKTALYESLRKFRRAGLVNRIERFEERFIVFSPTEEAHALAYQDYGVEYQEPKRRELFHSVACAETFIALSKRRNVTGLATEHEISKAALASFCLDRRPDGIIQVSDSDGSFELAVEIELSKKNATEQKSILSSYEKTFNRGMRCEGVLLVAPHKPVFESYQREIATLLEETQKRIVLLGDLSASDLNPSIYGEVWKNPGISFEKLRIHSGAGPEYVSILSTTYLGSGQGNTPTYSEGITDDGRVGDLS